MQSYLSYKLMKYKSKETYDISFEFSSDTRTKKCMLKQNTFSLLWYPLIEPIEDGNTLSVIRCSFVVQRFTPLYTPLPPQVSLDPVVHTLVYLFQILLEELHSYRMSNYSLFLFGFDQLMPLQCKNVLFQHAFCSPCI